MNNVTSAARRKRRVRQNIQGTADMPRLSVHRSSKYISAQLIDDVKRVTLIGVSEKNLEKASGTKMEKAQVLGKLLAEKAKMAKVKKVVFDRGAYRYHGRVKAFAEGCREGGLQF